MCEKIENLHKLFYKKVNTLREKMRSDDSSDCDEKDSQSSLHDMKLVSSSLEKTFKLLKQVSKDLDEHENFVLCGVARFESNIRAGKIEQMEEQDVQELLWEVNLEEYLDEVKKRELNGKDLMELKKQEFVEFNFTKASHKTLLSFTLDYISTFFSLPPHGLKPTSIEQLELLCCPITHELMRNPVVLSDGHTYEQDAITKWLEEANTSPMTNEVLWSKRLTPNFALKKLIRSLFVEVSEDVIL
eukprot:TRINITY_DN8506_c0_g1_i1.p1 TRINITY_DN8506_c0_g1~~TRINITY_DN8506_c0_g1_i1.p1  ORF type:complete len:244 (-),score=61.81 TRINITY_DN8506_c0_g1_i1:50-781(-)